MESDEDDEEPLNLLYQCSLWIKDQQPVHRDHLPSPILMTKIGFRSRWFEEEKTKELRNMSMGTYHKNRQAGQLPQGKGEMGNERIPGQTKGVPADRFSCLYWTWISDELPNGRHQKMGSFPHWSQNILEKALRSNDMVPTRADRCCYVLYSIQSPEQAWEHWGPSPSLNHVSNQKWRLHLEKNAGSHSWKSSYRKIRGRDHQSTCGWSLWNRWKRNGTTRFDQT